MQDGRGKGGGVVLTLLFQHLHALRHNNIGRTRCSPGALGSWLELGQVARQLLTQRNLQNQAKQLSAVVQLLHGCKCTIRVARRGSMCSVPLQH